MNGLRGLAFRALAAVLVLGPGLALTWGEPLSDSLPTSRGTGSVAESAPAPPATEAACCGDPDVPSYGAKIDFGSLPSGVEVTTQFRSLGVLFGHGGSSSAAATYVYPDGSRPPCPTRLVLSAVPHYSGWEFFLFVDPAHAKWATVDKVGASVGYCDNPHGCFLAAYDVDGNLVGIDRNSDPGFTFLSVQSASHNISCVLIGDCAQGQPTCTADPSGSATNCVTFSPPTPITRDLPAPTSVPMPTPPLPAPMASSMGEALLAALLLVLGIWGVAFARRRAGG